jgi:DnaJ-class molecular chaperone
MLLSEAYRILGVKKGSTKEEVRVAYKRLCLLYHPDKSKESSERFIQISDAYQTILSFSNEDKGSGSDQNQHNDSNADYRFLYQKLTELLQRLRKSYFTPPKIEININCTLDDIAMKNYKKITWRWKDKQGVLQTDTAYVPLFSLETSFTLSECGDFSILKQKRGDVVIQLHRADHTDYVLSSLFQKHDLIHTVRVNLYEYYYGIHVKTPSLGNGINTYDGIQRFICPYLDGTEILVPNKGLPCKNGSLGDLYIVIDVNFSIADTVDLQQDDIKSLIRLLFENSPPS